MVVGERITHLAATKGRIGKEPADTLNGPVEGPGAEKGGGCKQESAGRPHRARRSIYKTHRSRVCFRDRRIDGFSADPRATSLVNPFQEVSREISHRA